MTTTTKPTSHPFALLPPDALPPLHLRLTICLFGRLSSAVFAGGTLLGWHYPVSHMSKSMNLCQICAYSIVSSLYNGLYNDFFAHCQGELIQSPLQTYSIFRPSIFHHPAPFRRSLSWHLPSLERKEFITGRHRIICPLQIYQPTKEFCPESGAVGRDKSGVLYILTPTIMPWPQSKSMGLLSSWRAKVLAVSGANEENMFEIWTLIFKSPNQTHSYIPLCLCLFGMAKRDLPVLSSRLPLATARWGRRGSVESPGTSPRPGDRRRRVMSRTWTGPQTIHIIGYVQRPIYWGGWLQHLQMISNGLKGSSCNILAQSW